MISRFTKLQLVGFCLVTVVGLFYVAVNYTGIPQWFGAGYTVVAKFTDYGGIYTGAQVTYRGHDIGEVADLRLTANGVAMVLRIRDEVKVPADTRADVRQLSVVGEQYVDLIPQSRGGPYLSDGSVIPNSRTEASPPVEKLLANLQALVTSVGEQDLETAINELNKAFEGIGPELERLIDSTAVLVRAADANLVETKRLIRDGRTVLSTQVALGSAIRTFSNNLAKLTRQFVQSDEDIRAVLERGIPTARQTTALLAELSPELRILLGNLIGLGQVTVPRLAAVEQVLAVFPLNVATALTAVPGDGTVHFALIPNLNAPPVCVEGYKSTDRRYPQNTTPQPNEITAFCREDDDPDIVVRGARYAGGPAEPGAPNFPDPAPGSEREDVLELYLPR